MRGSNRIVGVIGNLRTTDYVAPVGADFGALEVYWKVEVEEHAGQLTAGTEITVEETGWWKPVLQALLALVTS